MTPERYEQVCEVFNNALERAPEDRASYVEAASGGDEALRSDVLTLVAGHELAERDRFFVVNSSVIDDISPELPDFGDYERIRYIGHGGMGVVYRAHYKVLDNEVALKMSLPRHLATQDDVMRFHAEARSMARLEHRNIVHVHEIEEYEGRPFFRMQLVEGKSLESEKDRYSQNPREAAELVEILAGAVHHAHQRGVLHRDLKPANVLIDEKGRPYVTDFGLAKRLGQDIEIVATGIERPHTGETVDSGSSTYRGIVGTARFMSPEHADPKRGETTLSDVYGLGGILYSLLTGRSPNPGNTPADIVAKLQDPEQLPESLRELNKRVDQDLQAVCMKCLEKDPERRYESAATLAEDLRLWRNRRETSVGGWSHGKRFVRWCRRQPVAAGLAVAVTVALVLAGQSWAGHLARQKELLESSGHVARLVASIVRDRLDELSQTVEQESRRPELAALLAEADGPGLKEHITQVAQRHRGPVTESPFESWAIYATDGTMLAQSLHSSFVGTRFDFRDYYRGALARGVAAGGPSAYVSRVYVSRAQGVLKFGITIAVLAAEADNSIVGLLHASVTTDRTMGLPQTIDSRYVPVLVAALEAPAEPVDSSPPDEYVMLFHPAFEHAEDAEDAVPFSAEVVSLFQEDPLNDDYRDPVGEREPLYEGRWLAGSAQIPDTSFRVVVQVSADSSAGSPPTGRSWWKRLR